MSARWTMSNAQYFASTLRTRATSRMRCNPAAAAIASNAAAAAADRSPTLGFGVCDLQPVISLRAATIQKILALVRRDLNGRARHSLLSAFRSKLALLDCADAAHRRGLVFRRELTSSLAPQSFARLRRRDYFLHAH